MKHTIHNQEPILIPYDDNKLEHVQNGPEYGQPGYYDAFDELLDYDDYIELANKFLVEKFVH